VKYCRSITAFLRTSLKFRDYTVLHPRILSPDGVTIDGVWIGIWIYWAFQHKARDYTLRITLTRRPMFPVTVFTPLLGNVFQQWTFLCFRAHVHAGWRPSHTNLLLFLLPSQGFLVKTVRLGVKPLETHDQRHLFCK
jgi:hypothetical protein